MSMEERYIYKIPVGFEAEIEEDMVVMHPRKESEDERIGKEIIEYIKVSKPYWSDFKDYRSWVAWLEKQKEQKPADIPSSGSGAMGTTPPAYKLGVKPAEWSEEDEKIYKVVLELLNSWSNGTIGGCIIPPNTDRYINWFKSLRPQKKCSDCAKNIEGYIHGRRDAENKLSEQFGAIITPEGELRMKPHWKPSEEQMEALNKARNGNVNSAFNLAALDQLYIQLQKLM